MASFYPSFLYNFIIFLSIFCRFTYSQVATDSLISPIVSNSNDTTGFTNTPININSTLSSNSTPFSNNSISVSTTTLTNPLDISMTTITTVDNSTSTSISTNPSTRSSVDNTRPSEASSKPGWWLLVALLITVAIVIIAGVIFYNRQHSPYRRQCKFRFLRNWRSREDDTDNIILQLEQSELSPGQWPPRISFT
ncbi:unnamed protein product [Rotaria sp. Silwood1]|nr:unnamed protein product [Rotaria sp. Silwood1]CAF3434169.1 unnamed protein product [Rotaria sp. Silwood1]